jgi:hypothetical protein
MRATSPELHGVRPFSDELAAERNRLRIAADQAAQETIDRRKRERMEQASGLAQRLKQIREAKKTEIVGQRGFQPTPKLGASHS